MNIKQVTDAYAAQKKEMLVVAKAALLEHFNKMFADNPTLTGIMWKQGIGGEGWDRKVTVDEMLLTTDEDPINADYGYDVEGGMYDAIFNMATDYQDLDGMLTDMFPYENGIKIIVTRDGFHTEECILW